MKTKRLFTAIALAAFSALGIWAQESIWVKFDDRFTPNKQYEFKSADSVSFCMNDRTGTAPVMHLFNPTFSKAIPNTDCSRCSATPPSKER